MYEEIAPPGPIDYLEFGVWEGESILYWAWSNRHDESRFFGHFSGSWTKGLRADWKPDFMSNSSACGGASFIMDE